MIIKNIYNLKQGIKLNKLNLIKIGIKEHKIWRIIIIVIIIEIKVNVKIVS